MAESYSEFDGISIQDAYSEIRKWYQANIDRPIDIGDTYRQTSVPFVRALPEVLSDLEIIAVFREVIAGRLEWAHNALGDGPKMPERARAALRTIGRSYSLTAEETDQLRTSLLWQFIKR
ncbi:MAG TPA: hypothetical protein VJ875_17640 [Pyrinomonadaceae bacterium]|nr:hypothetical protein [Pyrinomonadaceae bacterium]